MKIAYLRTDHWFDLGAGGSIAHIAGVTDGFQKLGHKIFFLSTDRLKLIDETKTPVYIIGPATLFRNFPLISELAYNRKFINKAKQVFLKENPDLVYQRCSRCNYSGIVLSHKFNIPFVLEYNGSFLRTARYWRRPLPFPFRELTEKIELANLHAANLIVAVSKALKSELVKRGIEEAKILVNPNGVDVYMPKFVEKKLWLFIL